MTFPGKIFATSVSFASILTPLGSQWYHAGAQSMGTREVAPVILSATDTGVHNQVNHAGEDVFGLQTRESLSFRQLGPADDDKLGVSATMPSAMPLATVPDSRPPVISRARQVISENLHRSAAITKQDYWSELSYGTAPGASRRNASWKERSAIFINGLSELAFPRNWRNHVSDRLNQFFDLSRHQPAFAFEPAGYNRSDFDGHKSFGNRWLLRMSNGGNDTGGNSGSDVGSMPDFRPYVSRVKAAAPGTHVYGIYGFAFGNPSNNTVTWKWTFELYLPKTNERSSAEIASFDPDKVNLGYRVPRTGEWTDAHLADMNFDNLISVSQALKIAENFIAHQNERLPNFRHASIFWRIPRDKTGGQPLEKPSISIFFYSNSVASNEIPQIEIDAHSGQVLSFSHPKRPLPRD